jgi:hypothetical protein
MRICKNLVCQCSISRHDRRAKMRISISDLQLAMNTIGYCSHDAGLNEERFSAGGSFGRRPARLNLWTAPLLKERKAAQSAEFWVCSCRKSGRTMAYKKAASRKKRSSEKQFFSKEGFIAQETLGSQRCGDKEINSQIRSEVTEEG